MNKPFVCTAEDCGQEFSTQKGLSVHTTKIHLSSDFGPFKKLKEFFEKENLEFDYEITKQKVIPVDDGFLIVSTNVPIIKLTPKYVETK